MSGNEPYRSASDESPDFADAGSGDIYGAPKSNVERTGPAAGELAGPQPLHDQQAAGEGGLDLRDTPSLGNRPASGARVVSVSEVFSEHFIGAEGASDFLGLDTEFDPTPVGSPGSAEFVMADVARATATEEEYQRGLMSPLSPLTPPEADPSYSPAPAPSYEPEPGFGSPAPMDDLPPEDDSFGADDPLSDDFELEPAPRKSKAGLLVGAVCLLGAAAAGVYFFAPGLLGKKPEAPPQLVAKKTPARAPAHEVTPPVADPEPVAEEPAPRPLEDFGTGAPTGEPDETPSDLTPPEEVAQVGDVLPPVPVVDPSAGTPGVEPVTATELDSLLNDMLLPDSFFQAHTGMLDLVWRGESVPLEAIQAPNRILTPAVGPVRVHLLPDTVFDGRLFAVGQNKVWIDKGNARLGIDGAKVERIEPLPKDVVLSEDGLDEVIMGQRVRARVAGGVIYGFVRSQRGNETTLVTESGARITLVDAVIEAAGDPKRVALKL
jgi:hypothetical protein